MLLELDNGELMDILESEQRLENAVEAALGMLAAPQGTAAAGVNQHPDSADGAHGAGPGDPAGWQCAAPMSNQDLAGAALDNSGDAPDEDDTTTGRGAAPGGTP
eukprot:7878967-Lingulodinium_polyedra.AAC.1